MERRREGGREGGREGERERGRERRREGADRHENEDQWNCITCSTQTTIVSARS